MSILIALQLYTVRDELSKDFEGTLAKVAGMGYKVVEFAGFYDRTPEQVRAICDKLALKVSSAHFGIESLRDQLPQTIAAAKTIGFNYAVVPYIGDDYRGKDGYAKAVKIMADAGKAAAAAGVVICYHNHSFEFDKIADAPGNLRGMDIIYGQDSPKDFQAELDVYWVKHGHDEPVAWMKKLTGRVPLLHIKDMDNTPQRAFTEVGTGILDFKAVIAAAPACGVKYFITEQDSGWKGGPLESAKTSLNNFKKILGV